MKNLMLMRFTYSESSSSCQHLIYSFHYQSTRNSISKQPNKIMSSMHAPFFPPPKPVHSSIKLKTQTTASSKTPSLSCTHPLFQNCAKMTFLNPFQRSSFYTLCRISFWADGTIAVPWTHKNLAILHLVSNNCCLQLVIPQPKDEQDRYHIEKQEAIISY